MGERRINVGALEYRGNTVKYVYDKCAAYKFQVGSAYKALRSLGYTSQGDDMHERDAHLQAWANGQRAEAAALRAELAEARKLLQSVEKSQDLWLFDSADGPEHHHEAAALHKLSQRVTAWLAANATTASAEPCGACKDSRVKKNITFKRGGIVESKTVYPCPDCAEPCGTCGGSKKRVMGAGVNALTCRTQYYTMPCPDCENND